MLSTWCCLCSPLIGLWQTLLFLNNMFFTCNHFFNLIVSTFLYSNLDPTKILSVSGARFRKSVQAWILQASFPASSFRVVHLRGLFSYFTLCFFVYFTFIPQWQSEKHWPLWNKSKASQTIIGCKLRKKKFSLHYCIS